MVYKNNMKKALGFTLIELIVTLAVVSILLLTGIPALNKMTESNRLVAQINEVAGGLALARSESIRTGSIVTLCASTDAATCAGVNVNNWESGWIAFTDKDGDNTVESGDGDTLIKIGEAVPNATLRLTLNDAANAGIYQFLPDGSSRDRDNSGTTVGTFTLCPNEGTAQDRQKNAKAVNINFVGRNSRAQGATATEKPVHDAGGDDVTCP